METANPAVLPAQYQGFWRLVCRCQEGVKSQASLQRATLPGTETSFSCCRGHREGFCSRGTDISRRPGRESRWEPGSAGAGPRRCLPAPRDRLCGGRRELQDISPTLGTVLLAYGLLVASPSVGPSPPASTAPWHGVARMGVAFVALGAGQGAMPQRGLASASTHQRLCCGFWVRKGALWVGVLLLPPKFLSNGEDERLWKKLKWRKEETLQKSVFSWSRQDSVC